MARRWGGHPEGFRRFRGNSTPAERAAPPRPSRSKGGLQRPGRPSAGLRDLDDMRAEGCESTRRQSGFDVDAGHLGRAGRRCSFRGRPGIGGARSGSRRMSARGTFRPRLTFPPGLGPIGTRVNKPRLIAAGASPRLPDRRSGWPRRGGETPARHGEAFSPAERPATAGGGHQSPLRSCRGRGADGNCRAAPLLVALELGRPRVGQSRRPAYRWPASGLRHRSFSGAGFTGSPNRRRRRRFFGGAARDAAASARPDCHRRRCIGAPASSARARMQPAGGSQVKMAPDVAARLRSSTAEKPSSAAACSAIHRCIGAVWRPPAPQAGGKDRCRREKVTPGG